MRSVNNLASMVVRSAQRFPDYPALAEDERVTHTYKQMALLVSQWAGALARCFRKGDRIAIVSENHPLYLPALFAIWHAGMVAVPINHKLHPKEVEFVLQDSGAKYVFGNKQPIDELTRVLGIPVEPVESDDPAWIFYTSGTTGKPKGAILTHGNLWAMCRAFLIDVLPVEQGDAMVHCCALSHGSGLYALPHVLNAGINVTLEGGAFDAAQTEHLLHQWAACTFGPPPVLNRIVSAKQVAYRDDMIRMRALIFGGSPLYLEDLKTAWEHTYCVDPRIVQIYGQAESPCTITSITREMYEDAFEWNNVDLMTSVGFPQHGIEIRICNEQGRIMDPGEDGEVCVRGPSVMAGYWGNPSATASALRNGWLHTGDIGHIDSRGYLYLSGRAKEMIKASGFSVYPREIEEVLLKHAAVRECAVVGERHPEYGESIVAYVVRSAIGEGMDDANIRSGLDSLCLTRIARFKRPREYRFVPELPMGNTGKVLKRALVGA